MAAKEDLIDHIARNTGDTHAPVKAVVRHFFHRFTAEPGKGNRLEFRGSGVFGTKTTPARTAQNPRMQEEVRVPARRRVVANRAGG